MRHSDHSITMLRARFGCVGSCVVPAAVVLTFCSPARPARYQPAAPATAAAQCTPGLQLRLSSPGSSPGSLLLAEMRTSQVVDQVKGEWNGKEILFWRDDDQTAPVWRGLIGIDLEQPKGDYMLAVFTKSENVAPLRCSVVVAVRQGHFATERLRVQNQFVQPNPEQLARALAERQRLREIFATVTPERLWRGRFRFPLAGVTTGTNFGRRRILNGEASSPHSGVDFPATAGTSVYASQSGRVILAEPLFFSGNTVIVDHGLGVYTLYAHLESLTVGPGESVAAGALLGKVGATGRVTGPHLHWGLTVNRARVDPLQLVKLFGAPSR